MGMTQTFKIESKQQADDGIGGFNEFWMLFQEVEGYLDLVNGTDLNTTQQAFIEESTHVLVIPNFVAGINDDMRVMDKSKRIYSITYADDPVGQHHHNEVYCKYIGVDNNE